MPVARNVIRCSARACVVVLPSQSPTRTEHLIGVENAAAGLPERIQSYRWDHAGGSRTAFPKPGDRMNLNSDHGGEKNRI